MAAGNLAYTSVLGADNYHVSADYPGVVRGFVEQELGAKLLFLCYLAQQAAEKALKAEFEVDASRICARHGLV